MRRFPDPFPAIPTQRGSEPPCPAGPATDAPGAEPADPHLLNELHELRGLVHDLGNGLSTMALLLEAARSGAVPTFGMLELLEQETSRLMAVAHSRAGRPGAAPPGQPPPEPVPVHTVLRPLARIAGSTGGPAVRLVPGPDTQVHIDPAVLSRVVRNLLDNAVRAAGPTGCVRISVQTGPDGPEPAEEVVEEVVIEIADDGPGYPYGPPGTARIGLDLVKRLLAACGGRLELHGAAPHGTRARVVLPGGGRRGPGAG